MASSHDWSRPEQIDERPSNGRHESRNVTERSRKLDAGTEEFEAVLDLLDDEYTQQILAALVGCERPARELMEICDASPPTVYRRLNRLQDHGLVIVGIECHHQGHHRKVFQSMLERATIDLSDGTPQLHLVLATGSKTSRTATATQRET